MKNDAIFRELWVKAHEAGMAAGSNEAPTPMVIRGYAPILDGACGFAWVNVHPGNSAFANWAKKFHGARKAYGGGVMVKWVSEFNQSVARKEAYAGAFAKVLNDGGIKAYAGSRLD